MSLDLQKLAEETAEVAWNASAQFQATEVVFAALEQVAAAAPRWMDRPNAPGRWLCVMQNGLGYDWRLTQEGLDGGVLGLVRCYGPIPEEPKG